MMKKTAFLIFILITSISCAQDKLLRIVWDQYSNYDEAINVKHFLVYKWSGDSDTLFKFEDMIFVETVIQIPLADSLQSITYFPMQKWIRGACIAEDSLGRKSEITYSRFYMPPEDPNSVRIKNGVQP